jgi:hypothetical protein
MAEKNPYSGVRKVVYLTTNIGRSCADCSEWVGMEKLQNP